MHMLKKATDAVTSAALYNSPPQGVGSWYCKVDLLAARLKGGLLLFLGQSNDNRHDETQQANDKATKLNHQAHCFVRYCHALTSLVSDLGDEPTTLEEPILLYVYEYSIFFPAVVFCSFCRIFHSICGNPCIKRFRRVGIAMHRCECGKIETSSRAWRVQMNMCRQCYANWKKVQYAAKKLRRQIKAASR
jgi:hypothetical protein